MITPENPGKLVRVTLTLDPVDVDLLDRLGKLEGRNRSQEMRGVLEQLRPVLEATVQAFEAALAQRDRFDKVAATAAIAGLQSLEPELEELTRQFLGAMSRIEGQQAAADAQDPRPSNHGGHNSTPTKENVNPDISK